MQIKLFSLKFDFQAGEFDSTAWEVFVATHNPSIIDYKSHFSETKEGLYCHILVSFRGNPSSLPSPLEKKSGKGKVPNVSAKDFPVYEALRRWRLKRSAEQGIPPYVVLKNRQLEDLVEARPKTRGD